MNAQTKQHIAEELKELVTTITTQNKLAKRVGISPATLSQMINGNWDLIKDDMWRKVEANLGLDLQWQTAETRNMRHINNLLTTAQSMGIALGISYEAGVGKSHAYKAYARKYRNVIYVECKNYWSKRSYIKNLLSQSGLSDSGKTEELIETFFDYMKGLEKPLIIIDQADKLKDPSLDLFMDFYNELDGKCGFLLSGVPALKKRIEKGVQRDKIGYRELYSRIGRKFIPLEPVHISDVRAICIANGIEDEDFIKDAFALCSGDLRRVKREVEKHHLLNQSKKSA